MPNSLTQMLALLQGGGWATDVQRSGIRPGYGLGTATGVGQLAKSPYERTLRPGETRSREELRDMLAEVILAGGAGASPLTGPTGKVLARQMLRSSAPARVAPDDFSGQVMQQVPRDALMAKPITGKGGAQIIGYKWQSRIEDVFSPRTGDTVAKRVSDWEKSGTSTGTGREIVHHFYVRHPDGRVTLEGINSAVKILGLSTPNLKSIAKVEAGKQAYKARENAAIVQDFETHRSAETPDAASQIFARRNPPSPLRPNDPPAVGILMRKGNKWTKATVGHANVLQDAGWERVE